MIPIAGRKGLYEEWITPDGLTRLEGWARDGLTDEQICQKIGIHVSTLCEWKNRFPQLSEAIKKGKAPVDIAVENALVKSALGYTIKVKEPIKVRVEKMKPGIGRVVEEHIEMVEREIDVPPNVTAQFFWLKNRRPDKWRDKPLTVEDTTTMEKLDAMLAEVKNHATNAKTG